MTNSSLLHHGVNYRRKEFLFLSLSISFFRNRVWRHGNQQNDTQANGTKPTTVSLFIPALLSVYSHDVLMSDIPLNSIRLSVIQMSML